MTKEDEDRIREIVREEIAKDREEGQRRYLSWLTDWPRNIPVIEFTVEKPS